MEPTIQTTAVAKDSQSLMQVGKLLSNSIEIYKKTYLKILFYPILLSLLGILPGIIVLVSWLLLNSFVKSSVALSIINIILGTAGVASLFVLIYACLLGSLVAVFVIKDNNLTLKPAAGLAKKYVWQYFVISFLAILLIILGFVLFIIPGILAAVWFSFTTMVLIFENYRGYSALKRSKELVKGYFWPVFGRYLLILAVSTAISLPALMLPEGTSISNIYEFIVSIARFLISPFYLIFSYLMFNELVKIKGVKA